jgi:aminoglycoside phosphotransferase (APT) family kinase protein
VNGDQRSASGAKPDAHDDETRHRVSRLLAQIWPNSTVATFQRVEKGISSLTYVLVVETDHGPVRLFAKCAPSGRRPTKNMDVMRQAQVLSYLRDIPEVPAPAVIVQDPGEPPGRPPLFVMSEIAGDAGDPWWASDPVMPDRQVADRAVEMMRVLGTLHRVTAARLPAGESPLSLVDEVNRWRAVFAALDDQTLAGEADALYSRLLAAAPAPTPACLTHGDYRFGNIVFQGAAVSGVIDWELWAASDARFDVANVLLYSGPESALCLRESTSHPSPDLLLEEYQRTAVSVVRDLDWFMDALRYKSAAALGLLVRNSRRRGRYDPLMAQVAERIPPLLGV